MASAGLTAFAPVQARSGTGYSKAEAGRHGLRLRGGRICESSLDLRPMSRLPASPPCPSTGCPARTRRAFTLIELLTVISIIGILAAILIPTIQTALTRARLATCTANLHSIGAAFQVYTQDNHGYLPAPEQGGTGALANPLGGTWQLELVTYLEGQIQSSQGSATVLKWPDALTDPEYLAIQGGVLPSPLDPSSPHGFGMMTEPYLAATPSNPTDNDTSRLLWSTLPNPGLNILAGCSDDVTFEPTKIFQGNPPPAARYGGEAAYLYLDGSVRTLDSTDAQTALAIGGTQ